ncbi:Shedu immune nuclease family protein [Pseudomonas brassicacearum]|uniref:Shedu protein SduA C-terminal domain-containing protein n=1 Tax=Pseudomonas brassicacearum TaxID=930166 RepID=A0A423GJZ1_9PSED|nr:Shedu immune nuclease family protein [Pseudomonas brassicacearum]ROM90743.1 hypothetical protein BK658_25490 [Pseudomonas brassicacearum]
MKVIDMVHNYPDGVGGLKRGLCRVRSFVTEAGTVVLLTDLDDKNDGMSVTNAIERIIKSLHELGIVIGPATYIEHYEDDDPLQDEYEIVTVNSIRGTQWKTINRADALVLIGCPVRELDERSLLNGRIVTRADQLRFSRDPFVDSPWQESQSVIKRRLEIADGMISKSEIDALISTGAGEREIQRLLKQDLSIFGEAYAKPDDEYICFSEFPLGDGQVDFVVFTGRSRMDVILIEVKGADFNLLNADHYKAFNHKINQAASQIRDRVGHIFREPAPFRDHAHSIRRRAERGEQIHNAFVGPHHSLQVDPQKDINIRTVLIGGRTVDDRVESAKRYDFERTTTPPVRVESWDTWLRRLQRS